MSPIVLKRLDSNLYMKINDLARARNVSVEEQIISVLQEVLQQRSDNLLQRADAIAAMTPKGVKQTDCTVLIREDRDR